MPARFRDLTLPAFAAAAQHGFPPFLSPVEQASPVNALPYTARLGDLRAAFDDARRCAILDRLEQAVNELANEDIMVELALIGGSVLHSGTTPKDLDCVLFYRLGGATPYAARPLSSLERDLKATGLDARLVPLDGDPLVLLKCAMFFNTLFSLDKISSPDARHQLRSGPVIIDFRSEDVPDEPS